MQGKSMHGRQEFGFTAQELEMSVEISEELITLDNGRALELERWHLLVNIRLENFEKREGNRMKIEGKI